MEWKRLWKHLGSGRRAVNRCFPSTTLDRIEEAVAESETHHRGEIRFAVEGALDIERVVAGVTARERAIEVFAGLHVWDTEENNGVLIYLLLADHDIEIVADRGAAAAATEAEWEEICKLMERLLAEGHYQQAALEGIRAVDDLLARYFPSDSDQDSSNQLPDRPAIL